eukprot:CAMPEP_0183297476 /NCGR_PEP_ID=MMETSP0160_2-20130417/4765_1 /TAXON_ID=2839 ORGANISM="Odontella Sinensis, Strain Grunow 1884" /NCGR_SAMPLE_ID=MMETSP0160_2 /ASSEMBLY_ACC=CAM_ASM_000250 /LENGTH=89 /DNA_ID=CAMNT_0025459307 /DNA_START=43 /DNA_END=308 /DNA_ORIENTATION=-
MDLFSTLEALRLHRRLLVRHLGDSLQSVLHRHSHSSNAMIFALLWLIAVPLLKVMTRFAMNVLFGSPMPPNKVRLPRNVPHDNPDGSAV